MMPAVQIKWLHGGRFRRFELKQLTFVSLLSEMQKRVPSFSGEICYVDEQTDKIVVESDQDLLDMVGYFYQLGESVVRIQTGGGAASNDLFLKNDSGPSRERGMGESESADEGGPSNREPITKRKREAEDTEIGPSTSQRDLTHFVEKIEQQEEDGSTENSGTGTPSHFEENAFASYPFDWTNNFGRRSTDSAQSSSGGGPIDGVTAAFDAGTSNPVNPQRTKRITKSSVIACMECGMLVANAGTSLKSHVNLHHLKLPIYSCRHCGQTNIQLQKAATVRHIERDHPGKSVEEIDYHYPHYSGQIQQKMIECFPLRSAEKAQIQE